MKTLKSRTIKKGIMKGERIKVKELTVKEQEEYNCKFVVTVGEYDDIDHEEDTLECAIDFYNDYENN